MAQITGLFIGVDGTVRLENLDSRKMLPRLYELINTDIVEAPYIMIGDDEVDLWIDEEEKFRQERNPNATYLWHSTHGMGDYIAGNAVLTGPVNRYGYSTSIPTQVIEKIRDILTLDTIEGEAQ